MKVWLEDWEWQCCGEPFALGSEVEWGLLPLSAEDRSFLVEPLGADVVDRLTHVETHHEDAADPVRPTRTRGRVESIDAVYWARAPRPGDDGALYPVSGTAVLERRDAADGWEPEGEGALRFEGYIVDLTPLDA